MVSANDIIRPSCNQRSYNPPKARSCAEIPGEKTRSKLIEQINVKTQTGIILLTLLTNHMYESIRKSSTTLILRTIRPKNFTRTECIPAIPRPLKSQRK